jgi:hypothetical protein
MPPVTPQQVLEVVGRSYNVKLSRMSAMRTALEGFLLLLLDRATIDRVLNGSSPLHAPGFSLLFKRWTRLANTAATTLPIAVDVELRDVSAHAWEASTTQVLLGGSCLVRAPLLDMATQRDLSAFSVSSWAAQLDSIPPMVNLIIPEPALVHAELLAVRRGLLYKVQVSLLSSRDEVEDPHPKVPSSPEQGRRRRRWRCRSPSPRPLYSGDATRLAGPTGTAPVHSRLGSGGRHAPPDTSAMDVDVAAESSGGFPSPVPQASASSFHEREGYSVVREENPSPDPVRKVPLPMSAGADSALGTPVQVDLDSSFRPAGLRLEHSQPKSAAQPGPAAPSSVLDGGLLEVVASGQCPASPLLRAPAAVAITANRPASTEDFELQAREDDLADLGASVDPYASAPCPPSPVPEANQAGSMLGSRSEAVNQSEGHCQQTPAPTFEVVPFCHVYCRRRRRQWRSHVVAKCTPTLQDFLDKQCKTEMNSVATVLRYTPFASALASPQAGASHRSWNPLQLLKSRPLSLESPSRWGA